MYMCTSLKLLTGSYIIRTVFNRGSNETKQDVLFL